jgi:membrane-associated protease RseP (regulator of RpoE activity)
MKITSYNIGYGPKIISFNDTKTETEFALRAFPFGGYDTLYLFYFVLFFKMIIKYLYFSYVAFPPNAEYDDEGNIIKEFTDDKNLLQNRPPLQRAIVICAGNIMSNL